MLIQSFYRSLIHATNLKLSNMLYALRKIVNVRNCFYFIRTFISLRLHAQYSADSTRFDSVNILMESKQYEAACSLYIDISKQLEEEYTIINSKVIDDLQKTYSITELQLQATEQYNHILLLLIILGLSLVIGAGFIVAFINNRNHKIRKVETELKTAKKLEEQSMRNKSLMISNMSHEIRTPLNALAGFSEIVALPDVDDDTRQLANDLIVLNSELLLKLINDVVDLSCLNLKNMEFKYEPCEIVSFSHNVLKTIDGVKHTDAEICFNSELKKCVINTDASRLQQLLINLLMNATKFTPTGSITLNIASTEKNEICFSVIDTGCGIPPEKQDSIFNRFETFNGKDKEKGFGLGLPICRSIIGRLGGKIWIDKDYNQGACFKFTLPLNHH